MAPPPQQLVLAASSADAGVAAWDFRTGAEAIRHRPCASRPRALTAVADRFLAAAQAPAGNSAPIHFYQWDKPQVAVKSFPAEPIRALIADPEGCYLIGGGVSGDIFFWEKRKEEMERLEKEKQLEIRSYKGLMVQEKTLQELEDDLM